MQLDILNLSPNEIEGPLAPGEYVIGDAKADEYGHRKIAGYIASVGRKWLIGEATYDKLITFEAGYQPRAEALAPDVARALRDL